MLRKLGIPQIQFSTYLEVCLNHVCSSSSLLTLVSSEAHMVDSICLKSALEQLYTQSLVPISNELVRSNTASDDGRLASLLVYSFQPSLYRCDFVLPSGAFLCWSCRYSGFGLIFASPYSTGS
jgi:hypothetical protein